MTAPGNSDLSRGDIASLLLTGRTLQNVSAERRAVLAEQAVSFLGSTLAQFAESSLGETLPVRPITVKPALIAGEADPGARFTLGAALTDRLAVTYSVGLNNAEEQIWIVSYDWPKRISTQLIRQQDNEFTGAIAQRVSFDLHEREDETTSQPRATISEVGLDIVQGELDAEFRKAIRIEPGQSYDYWKAWNEAERLTQKLRDRGYLGAIVDVAVESSGPDTVSVQYRIDAGERIEIVLAGDPLDSSIERAIATSWDGRFADSFLLAELSTRIEGQLFERQYYLASVETRSQQTESGRIIHVDVAKGPRGRRVVVEVTGNKSLSRQALLQDLPGLSTSEFHELLTVRQPRLKELLRLRFADSGFLDATIGEPVRTFDTASGELTVTIPVTEGPRFEVARVELEGVTAFETSELLDRISLDVGDTLRLTSIVRARSALASHYRGQGFPAARVTTRLEPASDTSFQTTFVIDEGSRATVGDVRVVGNLATHESLIRRQLALEPGEPLRLSGISDTQSRLYDLNVFRSADVVVGPPAPDSLKRDITIQVRESPDLNFDYGARYTTDGRFQLLGEVGTPNLFGRAHQVSFRALVASDSTVFRGSYQTPYFATRRLYTDFFVERETTEEVFTGDQTHKGRSWTFTAQQTKPLRPGLNVQWSYSFNRLVRELPSEILGPFVFAVNRSILTGALVGDYRDNVVSPRRSLFWNTTLQAAPEALGSETPFIKFYGQLFAFVPLGEDTVWASGFRLGATAFDQVLIEEDRFKAGGSASVRGFAQETLGPRSPEGIPVGGGGLLVLNQEVRFPIYRWLRGAGFYDAGNVFPTTSDISFADLRHNVGAGLRLEVPFGVFRFDVARVLSPRPDEDPWRFIFTLGNVF